MPCNRAGDRRYMRSKPSLSILADALALTFAYPVAAHDHRWQLTGKPRHQYQYDPFIRPGRTAVMASGREILRAPDDELAGHHTMLILSISSHPLKRRQCLSVRANRSDITAEGYTAIQIA
jgi:hypothetical protein